MNAVSKTWTKLLLAIALGVAIAAGVGCGGGDSLTVYSGRSGDLVGPIVEQFQEDTGIGVKVRYGETAELAATILEEGGNSPADVFFAQDAGALGALAHEARFAALPLSLLERVPAALRSPDGVWVGISGRARVVAYNVSNVDPADLPDSVFGFVGPEWRGRIGWAPTNGSFQAFVTGLRLLEGEDRAREWLEGINANGAKDYPNNVAALESVANGEVDVAFVNHYYLHRALAEQGEGFGARNHYLPAGDPGALINVAGAGILTTSGRPAEARQFIDYLLSPKAQEYFATQTFEHPLIEGVSPPEGAPSLSELDPPDIDLSELDDLQGTLALLRETGVLP